MHILSISENILSFICGIGLLQGILLALLLYFHKKSDRSVNKFLSIYLGSLTLIMAGSVTIKILTWQNSFFYEALPLLPGPLMYFYVRSFKETITWRKAFPHLILFIVYLPLAYIWVDYLAGKYPDAADIPEEAFRSPLTLIFGSLRLVQLFAYYFLSHRELNSYRRTIQHMFSETSQIDLKWVRWLINGYLFIIAVSVGLFVLIIKSPDNFYLLYLINLAIATPYIYMVAYKGISQPTIWQKDPQHNKPLLEERMHEIEEAEKTGSEKQRNQKQKLNDTRIGEIVSRITTVMERDKLFNETELTLQDLSDRLQYPPHQVSLAINEGLKRNFYDLVNGYRVEEAKRLLLDPDSKNYTVLSVGFEAGFNSKTTFNTVFKKFTGLTPTEFRESNRVEEAVA